MIIYTLGVLGDNRLFIERKPLIDFATDIDDFNDYYQYKIILAGDNLLSIGQDDIVPIIKAELDSNKYYYKNRKAIDENFLSEEAINYSDLVLKPQEMLKVLYKKTRRIKSINNKAGISHSCFFNYINYISCIINSTMRCSFKIHI